MLAPKNSPLVDYALRGLDRCWLPELGRWSHIYHLDNRDPPNESVPESDVFYTLNVLLALAHVRHVPANIVIKETFQRNATLLVTLPVSKYALGVALWAAGELQLDLPGPVLHHIEDTLLNRNNWRDFRAQDFGMILVGITTQASLDQKKWFRLADRALRIPGQPVCSPSGLFFDEPMEHGVDLRHLPPRPT